MSLLQINNDKNLFLYILGLLLSFICNSQSIGTMYILFFTTLHSLAVERKILHLPGVRTGGTD